MSRRQPDWERRAAKALKVANDAGLFDGGHHKMWVIDQMVRALTGCPDVTREAVDGNGAAYQYVTQGESPEYLAFVSHGDWDEGTPP